MHPTRHPVQALQLDGSQGEGGGQILRSALSLSMLTGTSFTIERIRAGRARPGLLRQHLTAVRAAAEICSAKVSGDTLGSSALQFEPGAIRGGDYHFAIGSAGSCTLVLQTLLPALWFADAPSTVTITGGTHNQAAPPADFLISSWAPLVARMGVCQSIALRRHGFYPAGGGELFARTTPVPQLRPLELIARGQPRSQRARAIVAAQGLDVARAQVTRLGEWLGQCTSRIHELPASEGPGNVVLIEFIHEHVTEIFSGFGQRGRSATSVADAAIAEAEHYRTSIACVGEHLADQLLLPIALAGSGRFTCTTVSSHFETNIDIIQRFLPVAFTIARHSDGCELIAQSRSHEALSG
ncbi:MAG: RNA 3'-terminal phosphate cyclase [Rhodocyclaceae bacterium]|nr:RNA 3'-terminal phosphate cyclase [Rhodocyclaceae bacterium]